jgi:methyl-accepting chemotaxis protein
MCKHGRRARRDHRSPGADFLSIEPMKLSGGWHIPPRRVVLWHAIAALPLAAVVSLGGYLSYHYHALSIQNRAGVDRAYEVLDGINALFVAVEDADVAQRDFIITGSREGLVAFQAALKATDSRDGRLHQLLRDAPAQLLRLRRLEQAIDAKASELGQTVQVRQTQGFAAARNLIERQSDRVLLGRVREEAAGLVHAERQLLVERLEVSRSHERAVLLAGVCIAALSVCIRLIVAFVLGRLRKRGMPAAAD